MKLKISRIWLLLLGTLVIFAGYFVQRVQTYRQSVFTAGVVLNDEHNQPDFLGDIAMNLYYFVGMKEYCVPTFQYAEMENAIVVVRYRPNAPEKGSIYTRGEFWLLNMLWLIIPLMLWAALILSFVDEHDRVEFIFSRRRCPHNPNQNLSNHAISDSDSAGRN